MILLEEFQILKVAQLDDTRVGSGTFVTLKGACGKTTTTTEVTTKPSYYSPLYVVPAGALYFFNCVCLYTTTTNIQNSACPNR